MDVEKVSLGDLPGKLLDLDLTPSGRWIAALERDEQSLVSFWGEHVIEIPERCRFPRVRAAGDDGVVLVDARTRPGRENAWHVSASGDVLAGYHVGDGIQDLLVSDDLIVVTFFDEGVFGGGIGGAGLIAFDYAGAPRFSYQTDLVGSAVDISDCYCACLEGKRTVVFLPYTDFPLVRLDLATRQQKVWHTPRVLHGANALTSRGGTVVVWSPYDGPHDLLMWTPGEREVRKIGEYQGRLRGLPRGRFLSVSEQGYALVSVEEDIASGS